MSRLAILGTACVGLASAGCLDEMLNRTGEIPGIGKPIEPPKLPEASLATAARVDQVGRELLAANPFLGVDPTFHTVAHPDPAIGHPDFGGVVVTEGLVNRCKTDAELMAVLATELGQMSAEKRLVDRVRSADASSAPAPTDARATTVAILRAAGRSERDLEGVAQLLSEAARNRSLVGGLSRKPDAPRWSP
jgi:hypothetical protein